MKASYTRKMLKEFDELTNMLSSPHQMTRHEGRFAIPKFVKKHGQLVCDAMFHELQKRDKKRGRK